MSGTGFQPVKRSRSKTDPRTGEWLYFGIEYGRTITVHLTTFTAQGTLKSYRFYLPYSKNPRKIPRK